MSKAVILLAGLALVAVPFAASAEESADPAKKERLICKRFQRPGTIAGFRRVCGTKEYWEAQRRETRRLVESALDSCRTRSSDPGNPTAGASAAAVGSGCPAQ